jgi:hypothetical protein
VSLVLHGVAILFLLPKLLAAPATTHRPEVIQVRLTTPAPEARANEELPPFTELPADRADAEPQTPDFLSNVTSRARDQVPGGDTNRPRLEGEGDVPAIQLERGKTPSASGAASPSPSTEPAGLEAADPRAGARKPGAVSLVPVPADALVRDTAGNAGIDQPAMADPGGNATLLGDVSLSTIAWDYAPWLRRFGMQLQERWYAPPAYLMGVLKEGGWALLELEISRTGKVQRLVLLDEQGHPSLIRAAESALRSMVPIEPLPADFPEPTLTLRIRMIYPRVRPQ